MRPSLPSAAAATAIALFSNQAAAQHKPASDPLRINVGVPEVLHWTNPKNQIKYFCEFSKVSKDTPHIMMPTPVDRPAIRTMQPGPLMAVEAAKEIIFVQLGIHGPDFPEIGTVAKTSGSTIWNTDAKSRKEAEPLFGMNRLNEIVNRVFDFRAACFNAFQGKKDPGKTTREAPFPPATQPAIAQSSTPAS